MNTIRKYILETAQDLGAYDTHKGSVSSVGIYNHGQGDGYETSDTEDTSQFSDSRDNETPAALPDKINYKTVDSFYSGRNAAKP